MIKRFLKNLSKVFILKILGTAMLFVFQLVLSNMMGAAKYGQFTIFQTVINIFILITVFGMDSTLIRYVPRLSSTDKTKYRIFKTSFIVSLIISLAISALMFLFKYPIMNFFKINNERYYYIIPLALIFMSLGKIIDGFLQGEKRTDIYTFFSMFLVTFIKLIIFLALSFKVKDLLLDAIIAFTSGELIVLFIRILYVNRGYKSTEFNMNSDFGRDQYKRFFTYSVSLLAILGISTLTSSVDKITINYFIGSKSVGVYKASESLMGLVGIFASPFIVFWPFMSELYKKNDMVTLQKIFRLVTKLISVMAIPAIVFMVVFSNDLLKIYGKTFTGGTLIFCVLLISTSSDTLSGPVGALLNMTDYANYNLIDTVIGAVIDISLNLILVPRIGPVGAAIATASTTVTINLINIVQNKLFLNVFPYDKDNAIMIGIGVCLFFLDYKLYFLLHVGILFKMCIIGILSYVVFIVIYYFISKPDFKSLISLIKKE